MIADAVDQGVETQHRIACPVGHVRDGVDAALDDALDDAADDIGAPDTKPVAIRRDQKHMARIVGQVVEQIRRSVIPRQLARLVLEQLHEASV